jgi:hypothetical protein
LKNKTLACNHASVLFLCRTCYGANNALPATKGEKIMNYSKYTALLIMLIICVSHSAFAMKERPFVPRSYHASFVDEVGTPLRSGLLPAADKAHYDFWHAEFEKDKATFRWEEITDKGFIYHRIAPINHPSDNPTLIFLRHKKTNKEPITVQDYSFFKPFLQRGFSVIAANEHNKTTITKLLKEAEYNDLNKVFIYVSEQLVPRVIRALTKKELSVQGIIFDTPLIDCVDYFREKIVRTPRFQNECRKKALRWIKINPDFANRFQDVVNVMAAMQRDAITEHLQEKLVTKEPITRIEELIHLCRHYQILWNASQKELPVEVHVDLLEMAINMLGKYAKCHTYEPPFYPPYPCFDPTSQKPAALIQHIADFCHRHARSSSAKSGSSEPA